MTDSPTWLLAIQAAASVSTTVGVLTALFVAVFREPRKAAEERRRHEASMAALERAEVERVGAQARKVVPSCSPTPMFGDNWWTVKIDNASASVTKILSVEVRAIDPQGNEVPQGCQRANNTMPVDQAFERSIRAALSGSLEGGLQRTGYGSMIPPGIGNQLANQMAPTIKKAMQEAMVGQFVKEWRTLLPPNENAVMAYTTTNPNSRLRITIDYEDEAGFTWQRTDVSQPRRTDVIEAAEEQPRRRLFGRKRAA